jgi:hypothetical protein
VTAERAQRQSEVFRRLSGGSAPEEGRQQRAVTLLGAWIGSQGVDALVDDLAQRLHRLVATALSDEPGPQWLYSRVVKSVVHGFGRRPDPRSGDVHEF